MKAAAIRCFRVAIVLFPLLAACSRFKPQLPDKPISQAPGNCFLDSQKRGDATIRLDGWAYGNPQEAPVGIAVKVDAPDGSRTYYTQRLLSRSDVAMAFKSSSLSKTGFSISIPVTESPAGAKVSIISEGSKQNYVCKNTFVLK